MRPLSGFVGVHTHRTEKPPREDDEAVVRIRSLDIPHSQTQMQMQ